MKTAICYFSGTGNSRHAADRLVQAFPSAELKPIVSLLAPEHPALCADTVGIVFPIHAFTLPHIIEEFLRRAEMSNAMYVFALSMRECSSRVAVRMDRELDRLIPTIVEAARSGARKIPKDGLILGSIARTLFPLMTWIYRRTNCYHLGERLYADNSCSGCGTCAAVCLSQRITIDNGTPVWDPARPCLQCFACIHYCPEQAIQIRSSRTDCKGRFHYPGIDYRSIAEQRPDFQAGALNDT
jgi:ferredoxin